MNKLQIQKDLVAHLRTGLLADETDAEAQRSDALVDEDDSTSVDDISHEDQAGEIHGLIEQADEKQGLLADEAEKLDMSATETVRPGAVVEMDGEHYVVGIASSSFVSEGVEYAGLSTDAPIYSTLEGKRAGDTFTFADREHTIASVN